MEERGCLGCMGAWHHDYFDNLFLLLVCGLIIWTYLVLRMFNLNLI